MTDAGTLAGQRVSTCTIHVPPIGPWWADLVLEESPDLPAGVVELAIGRGTLRGTVVEATSGAFADRKSVRLVAGAAAWGALVAAAAYRNDSGVLASQVAQDVAAANGETLGGFDPAVASIGTAFVREAGPASRVLEAVIGGVPWWVDFDGTTQVGARATSTPAAGSYELLDFDPVSRLATIGLDDITAIGVGSILPADTRLAAAQTVRELRIEIDADRIQIIAWCGALAGTRSREAAALERIVDALLARRVLGIVEYRVDQMNGDRVDLQATSTTQPDLRAISVRGPAGVKGALIPGTLVLVQFIGGDRTRPVITHAQSPDGNGWAPTTLTLDATGASASIKAGKDATEALAWCSKLKDELDAIALSFLNAASTPGGGPLFWAVPTNQYGSPGRPVPAASALGTAKTVAE